MLIKLFSILPSLNDYEVKFPRWHLMAFQFLHVNALLKYSVLRQFASSIYLIYRGCRGESEWNNQEKVFETEDRIFNTFVVA